MFYIPVCDLKMSSHLIDNSLALHKLLDSKLFVLVTNTRCYSWEGQGLSEFSSLIGNLSLPVIFDAFGDLSVFTELPLPSSLLLDSSDGKTLAFPLSPLAYFLLLYCQQYLQAKFFIVCNPSTEIFSFANFLLNFQELFLLRFFMSSFVCLFHFGIQKPTS